MKPGFLFRLVPLLLFMLLAVKNGVDAQETPFRLYRDTVRLDLRSHHSPLCSLVLKDAEIEGNMLYCRFLERRYVSNWGFNDSYFCVINLENQELVWQTCSNHYDYNGEFVKTPEGIVHRNYDDSVMATFSQRRWHYRPLDTFPVHIANHTAPQKIYSDNRYRVDVLDLGEWGSYTWIYYYPLQKNLLYPVMLKCPVRMGDTLFLHHDSGIFFVEPDLIARSQKGFCTAEECGKMEEWGFLHHFYGNPDDYSDEKRYLRQISRMERRRPKIIKASFSDLPGIVHYWEQSEDWFAPADSLLLGMTALDDNLYALKYISGKQYMVAVDGGKMTPILELGSSRSGMGNKYVPGRVLLYGQIARDESQITHVQGADIHTVTLLHEQDTLPWLENDTFDSVLSCFHDHYAELNPERIHRLEQKYGFGSDRMIWDTLGNKDLFRPYFLLLTNKLMVENVFWLTPQGTPRTVIWDFGKTHSSDILDLFDTQTDELKKDCLQQVPHRLSRILGSPTRTEDDELIWETPEGTYAFVKDRLSFKSR